MARVPVVRGPGTYGTVTVGYRAVAGSADIGSDFALVEGTLSFPDGVGVSTINVTIIDDAEREFEEDFRLELFSVPGKSTVGRMRFTSIKVTACRSICVHPQ